MKTKYKSIQNLVFVMEREEVGQQDQCCGGSFGVVEESEEVEEGKEGDWYGGNFQKFL